MLKRLLASLAIVSLLAATLLLVYWWRSNHGHTDEFTLGSLNSTQTRFSSQKGRIAATISEKIGTDIHQRIEFYSFQQALAFCLIVPGLWLAITVRNLLPRPPGAKPALPRLTTRQRRGL